MDLRGIRDLVASLFIMLNQKTFILFRVEFLVAVVTVLFLAMFVMDVFRRHFHSTIMKAIFSIFDAVSDSVLIYLIGAMQAAPFKNELFPVWALVLVIFRHGIGFISGYGVLDPRGRRLAEFVHVTNLVTTAFLNWRRGSRFRLPLWSLFTLQMLRSLYRLCSYQWARQAIWLGGSSELISEYMSDPSKWKHGDCDPETMKGYRYLVFGERCCEIEKPRYVMSVKDYCPRRGHTKSLITLDKIWSCRHIPSLDPNNLGADNIQGTQLEDLSLAFALSRLLRCRLEDAKLHEDIHHQINRKLVKRRIVKEEPKRAFRIMELQLAFVNDYFNTRYPIVFWSGLCSLFLTLLQSILTVCFVCWLSVAIRKVYRPPDGELVHLVKGVNVDMIITWAFMVLFMFKEIWEMVAYLLSDWTRLLLVCKYVSKQSERVRNICMEQLILSFFQSKINDKMWHGQLDQYIFVQSYDDKPKFWNLIHCVTTGLVPKRDDGAKLGRAIEVPQCVQPAILEKISALLDMLDKPGSQDLSEPPADPHGCYEKPVNSRLPKLLTTLRSSNRRERYGWACLDLQTSSHIILVWHIATNLCEMALAKKQGVDLGKPGFFRSFMLYCCSYKPYLINVDEHKENNKGTNLMEGHGARLSNPGFLCSLFSRFTGCFSSKSYHKLTEELRKRYIIANSLSNYCAYLFVTKPDLIPDSFLVPKMVFQETMMIARDDILRGCDSLGSRYDKLMEVAESAAPNFCDVKKGDDVMVQGAMLAKELLDNENVEERWDILAGVWTELLVHIAPTWNAEAHMTSIESGGEFITNIWALLWHCGIEKSSLWPEYDAPQDDTPAAPQDNSFGKNNIVNPVEETQQASDADATGQLSGTEIHVEDDTQGTEKPEAGRLKIKPGGALEGQGSWEIEEVSQDTMA